MAELIALDKDFPCKIVTQRLEIAFKYTGEPVKCYPWGSSRHLVKECPKQRQPRAARVAAGGEAGPEPPTSSEELTESMDTETSQADTVTPAPSTEPTPASPPLSYANILQNLFNDSGDASRKRPPPPPPPPVPGQGRQTCHQESYRYIRP